MVGVAHARNSSVPRFRLPGRFALSKTYLLFPTYLNRSPLAVLSRASAHLTSLSAPFGIRAGLTR